MSKLAKWFRIIVCQWLLSICILVILAMSLRNFLDYWQSANWIQVQGKIVSLKATGEKRNEPDLHWAGSGSLTCQYAYTFENKNYFGNRIGVETFESPSPRASRYRQLKQQFNEDTPILVFVNPTAPTESALFRETLPEMYFGPAIGLFWFGALFWNYKRNLVKRNSPNE
jgi:hypothetical protein